VLVVCVKNGTKYGPEYVTKLRDGVARHLNEPHEFVCITDRPVNGVRCWAPTSDLPGWFMKLELFDLNRPLIYFDLDVVITGDLAPLLAWDGFGIIKDWWQDGFNSSVMKLTGNEGHIWKNFRPEFMGMVAGDQDYITGMMPRAKTFPPEWFPSYKANECQAAIPEKAMAVIFHGNPKPPECGGWVADNW
jgi:hypothetical protein